MKKNLDKFNHQDTIAVITSFPNPKEGAKRKREFNAIAWHSEKTLKNLSNYRRVIVLAEKNSYKGQSYFVNKNLGVKRVWSKKSNFSILSLAWEVLKMDYIKTVYIPFEFNLFGGTIHNLLFLFVLLILRLRQKRIVIEVHQVIENVEKLSKHVNIQGRILPAFYNLGLKIYYFLFGLLANNIIVFEQELKNRLKKYVPETKIITLSLSTQKNKLTNKIYARKKLGLPKKDFLVMAFGYINGYKGLDFMVEAFAKSQTRNIRLVIAGGKNPYLRDQKFYQRFYRNLISKAETIKKIILTGFVPDKKVGLYFSAADLIVLPYEVFMSASGPFSLALSYGKPIILSNKLIPYFKSADFRLSLKEAKLGLNDIFFPLNSAFLLALIKKIKSNKNLYHQLLLFSKSLAVKRSSKSVSNNYLSIFFPPLRPSLKGGETRVNLAYN